MELEDLGWNVDRQYELGSLDLEDVIPGRVFRVDAGHYGIFTTEGEISAKVSGRMRKASAALITTRNSKPSTAASSATSHSGVRTNGRTTVEPTRSISGRMVKTPVFLSSTPTEQTVSPMQLNTYWLCWEPA